MSTQQFSLVGTDICGYSKFMDTQNLLILKTCGLLNLWVIKKIKFVVTQFCGYFKFVNTQDLLILKYVGI